jgi:hypothetical protein
LAKDLNSLPHPARSGHETYEWLGADFQAVEDAAVAPLDVAAGIGVPVQNSIGVLEKSDFWIEPPSLKV